MVLIARVHPQPNGKVTLSNPDGTVISVQPGGEIESREAGTNGVYELATLNGLTAIYQPDSNGPQFVFSLV
jgi:hypothetical protein